MNSIITENEEQERIWEIRHQIAIERFASYDEYMDIPGYNSKEDELSEDESESDPVVDHKIYQENLEKRMKACILRYVDTKEYMEIPDMDLWLKLKNEIVFFHNKNEQPVRDVEEDDD